jgi:ABC-type multidrug transport system fused ATPase/permease subunit
VTLKEGFIIKPPPVTIWNILDYFLMDLAVSQDAICEETHLSKPLYEGLKDLVCKGNTEVLKHIDLGEPYGKPYYPFILIAYYVLFHRFDLDTAKVIYEKLKEVYDNYPYSFDRDEKCALNVLEKVMEDFTALRTQPLDAYKGRLSTRLNEIAYKVKKTECFSSGWGKIFKTILQSHLTSDPYESLELIKKALLEIQNETDTNVIVVDKEIMEAYNLLIERKGSPAISVFLDKMATKLRTSIEEIKRNLEWELKIYGFLEKIIVKQMEIREVVKELLFIAGIIGILFFITYVLHYALFISVVLTAILHFIRFVLKRRISNYAEAYNWMLKGLYRALWKS